MQATYKNFLHLNLLEDKTYAQLEKILKINRKQLSTWAAEKSDLLEQIRQSNQLYNSKKRKDGFDDAFPNKKSFYNWYSKLERICYYCKIEEEKLKAIFDYNTGILETARGRGRSLELERIDTSDGNNIYSKENCTLACYLCNNHKSDLITEEDHKKYFAPQIKKYLDDKYKELNSI